MELCMYAKYVNFFTLSMLYFRIVIFWSCLILRVILAWKYLVLAWLIFKPLIICRLFCLIECLHHFPLRVLAIMSTPYAKASICTFLLIVFLRVLSVEFDVERYMIDCLPVLIPFSLLMLVPPSHFVPIFHFLWFAFFMSFISCIAILNSFIVNIRNSRFILS